MSGEAHNRGSERTRRNFLKTTTALAGAALVGLPGTAEADKRHPKRGGTLQFGTREDAVGLDTHRNIIYFVSTPLTGMALYRAILPSAMRRVRTSFSGTPNMRAR